MKLDVRVSVQGEPGSNSDAAAQQMLPGCQVISFDSFAEALDSVHTGQSDLALIPVENSSVGRVADPHLLLPDAGLHIIDEFFMPIHFDLLAPAGSSIEQIKTVRSHVHAFGQCSRLLREFGWAHHVSPDTAGAAREVAALADPTVAALAPSGVAGRFGLSILRSQVEDSQLNATRFLLLSPEATVTKDRPAITTVIFRVRNVPAALYKCLGGFATNSVNITKLESYQLGSTFFASQFYIDFDGHVDDHNVKLALEEVGFFAVDLKVLGTYPAHPFRRFMREAATA